MKKLRSGLRSLSIILLVVSNIGCDQITKNVARSHIEENERISVVANYLTLTKVENSGAFLSLGDSLPFFIKTLVLTIFPALLLIGMLYFALSKSKLGLTYVWPMAFIIGGGIGNLYDRIVYGSVTDFLHLDFQLFQTGIFNMADVSIMIGALWLFLSIHSTKDTEIKAFW